MGRKRKNNVKQKRRVRSNGRGKKGKRTSKLPILCKPQQIWEICTGTLGQFFVILTIIGQKNIRMPVIRLLEEPDIRCTVLWSHSILTRLKLVNMATPAPLTYFSVELEVKLIN